MDIRAVKAQRYVYQKPELEEFDAALVALLPTQTQERNAYDGSLGPIETWIMAVVFDRATGVYYQLPLNQIREITPSEWRLPNAQDLTTTD